MSIITIKLRNKAQKMKQIVFIILTLIFAQPAFSANSLDELYRDLIRADNEGYLPLFVKNRKVPDILSDDSDIFIISRSKIIMSRIWFCL